jgi:hypothetical protein
VKKLLAAVGSVVLVAGIALAIVPAGAQVAQGDNQDIPWPTLRVMKTYPEGRKAPAGTVFTIHVECGYGASNAGVDGQSIDPVDLTFTADGSANPATPTSATPQGSWVIDGTYWTFTSKWLKEKDCTAEETDASSPGGLAALTVLNKCDFTATLVVPADDQATAEGNSGSPGCVNPANGATAPGPTPPGEVLFTHPWDFDSWKDQVCDAGPPDLNQDAVTPEGGSSQYCYQVGTLTVINDDPGNPEWSVAGEAVDFNPNFTG